MIDNTVGQIAAVIGAEPVLDGCTADSTALDAQIADLVADSRKVSPGSLFVALPGEHADGHDFVVPARHAGAVAAVTTRPVPGAVCLVTADPLAAIGRIGRHVTGLAKQNGLQVIGITGSSGKTTTKDLLAQILERVASVVAPTESMNNELGVPITASWITRDTRYLISEMGAKGVGHIRYLCGITPPDVGVELNVGVAHLGKFGSQDAIAAAKGELVEALPPTGRAVLNAGDPRIWAMAARTSAPVIGYGVEGDQLPDRLQPEVYAADLVADELDRWSFELRIEGRRDRVRLRLLGRHQVHNAVAAAAAAHAAGVDPGVIADTLSSVGTRSHWRMELHDLPGDVALINDAYNANPLSMSAALTALTRIGRNRSTTRPGVRTIAVLGEMLELGDQSDALHADVGRTAARLGVDRLITVGPGAAGIGAGARSAGMADTAVLAAADKSDAALLLTDLRPGDVVLIKASRDIGLETLGEQLLGR